MLKKIWAFLTTTEPEPPTGPLRVAYDEGWEAGRKYRHENPYPPSSKFHAAWEHGYRDSERREDMVW